ncbi:MAG: XdhC/CoxI family protein [Elusimicrobia bacterium]|nr:XdhC/CoxI family protein [Elusimicrobiota bacterium]
MLEDNLFAQFGAAIASGRGAVLVTVVGASGSTPRECGARMLVCEDGSCAGTVGGGKLEALALKSARAALKAGISRKETFDLTPRGIGMECAGQVELFFDVHAAPCRLLILGAGHVGQKIGEAAAVAGLAHEVADDRAEFANRERFPDAGKIFVVRPDRVLRSAGVDEKTFIVIVTRGHALDAECLAAALKTRAVYIGMIGSRSKIPAVFKALNRKGWRPERDGRVYAPIGLDCGGKSPGAIAVSVVAEILAVSHGRPGGHLRSQGR